MPSTILFAEAEIGTTFFHAGRRIVKISNSYFYITGTMTRVNAMNELTGELMLIPEGLAIVPGASRQPKQ